MSKHGLTPAQRERKKKLDLQRDQAIKAVADAPLGRIFLRYVLCDLGLLLRPAAVEGDAGRTLHHEGRRYVATKLLSELHRVSPGAFALLMAEDAADLAEDKNLHDLAVLDAAKKGTTDADHDL